MNILGEKKFRIIINRQENILPPLVVDQNLKHLILWVGVIKNNCFLLENFEMKSILNNLMTKLNPEKPL